MIGNHEPELCKFDDTTLDKEMCDMLTSSMNSKLGGTTESSSFKLIELGVTPA